MNGENYHSQISRVMQMLRNESIGCIQCFHYITFFCTLEKNVRSNFHTVRKKGTIEDKVSNTASCLESGLSPRQILVMKAVK